MALEKKYIIAAVRAESKDIVVMEIVDESSVTPTIKTAVFRLGVEEYRTLGRPTVGDVSEKLKVTLEVEKVAVEVPNN